MACKLGTLGIPTTLISDAAVFSVMPRVDKCFIGAHAILANGGILAAAGTHMVVLAAHHHAIPVICLSALYKLTPVYALDNNTFNELGSPDQMLSYEEGMLPCSS